MQAISATNSAPRFSPSGRVSGGNTPPTELLEINGDEIRLTREGLLRADSLLPAFFEPEHQGVRYT